MKECVLLERAEEPKDIVFALREECQLSLADIAAALGITAFAVRTCERRGRINKKARSRLYDLRDVCLTLVRVIETYRMPVWLSTFNPVLGRKTPLECIREGNIADVKEAIRVLAEQE